jgi:uridine kinase
MAATPGRQTVLGHVATTVLELPVPAAPGVLRVAIDGVDGAGKTTFADELAEALAPSGRETIRASVDGFHHPKAARYRLGRHSPEGFFLDSYNYDELRARLLEPLGPGGSGTYRTAAFDHRLDGPVTSPARRADAGAILVLDGIFLHRPELRRYWDYSIFLDVPFDISIPRGAQRGEGSPDPHAPENRRYVEGQRLYLHDCEPKRRASLIIDNEVLASPRILHPTHEAG